MKYIFKFGLLLGFLPLGLAAQVAPSPATGGASDQSPAPAEQTSAALPPASEVVTLPTFQVSENGDKGYLAANSVSATRINTPIADLPFSISAFTQQFIQDISAVDLYDVARFSAGVQDASQEFLNGNATFMIRGFVQPPEHDGFYETANGNIYVDTSDVERVEVVKGPASLLYGAISPGGTVNYITKQAGPNPFANINFQLGSYDYSRSSIDLNAPIIPDKLMFRINVTAENGYEYVQATNAKTLIVDPTVTWKINPKVSLRVSANSFTRSETAPAFNLPQLEVATPASIVASLYNPGNPGPSAALSNKTSIDYAEGYTSDSSNPGVSYYYPRFPENGNFPSDNDKRDTLLQSFEAELDVTLNDHWKSRLNFDAVDDNTSYTITGQSQAYLAPPNSLVYSGGAWSVAPAFAALTANQQLQQELAFGLQIDAQQSYFPSAATATQNGTQAPVIVLRRPLWEQINTDDTTLQGETVGDYDFDWGSIKPMFGVYYDRAGVETNELDNLGTAASPYFKNWDIDPESPTYYINQNTSFPISSLTNHAADNLAYTSDQAAYAILNASFFHDTVYLVGGARYNVSESQTTNYIAASNRIGEGYRAHYTTPQIGLGYKITNDLLLYASYSQSYILPSTSFLSAIEPVNGVLESVPTTQAKPTIGEGGEAGFKTNFLDGRIASTVSVYNIVENDLVSSITQSISGQTLVQSVQGAQETSKGVELETTISPTDNWQVFLSAAEDDARNTAEPAGESYFLDAPPSLFSKTLVNLWTRYNFTGAVRGLWVGAGGNYASRQLVTTSNIFAYWPAYTIYNAAIGYDWTWNKTQLSAKLACENLGNSFYVPAAQVLGMPRHFVGSITVRF